MCFRAAVDREYRVLKALEHTAVPVPRPLVLCQDSSVIGTQFYVMEFAAGAVSCSAFQGVLVMRVRHQVWCTPHTIAKQ